MTGDSSINSCEFSFLTRVLCLSCVFVSVHFCSSLASWRLQDIDLVILRCCPARPWQLLVHMCALCSGRALKSYCPAGGPEPWRRSTLTGCHLHFCALVLWLCSPCCGSRSSTGPRQKSQVVILCCLPSRRERWSHNPPNRRERPLEFAREVPPYNEM